MPYRHLQQKHMPRSNIASVGNRKRHRATAEAQSEYKLSDNANERQGLTPDDLVFQSLSDFVCASMGQSTPLSDLAKNKSRRCDSFYGLAAVVFPTQTFLPGSFLPGSFLPLLTEPLLANMNFAVTYL